MKKIILHIGRHKSGTTSLQQMLADNAPYFLDQGWLYPKSLRPGIAHHSLAAAYNANQMKRKSEAEREGLRAGVKDFWQEIETADQIILSSENFQNNNPQELVDAFAGYQLQIVVYFREISSYLLSAYAQRIKANPVTLSLEDYEEKTFGGDYISFLDRWEKAFPMADFQVRFFSTDTLVGGDVVIDFLAATWLNQAIDPAAIKKIKRDMNPSIGGVLLEFKRMLNRADHQVLQSFKGKNGLYLTLQKLALDYPEYRGNKKLPIALHQKLIGQYSHVAEGLADRFGVDASKILSPHTAVQNPPVYGRDDFLPLKERLIKVNPAYGKRIYALVEDQINAL